MAEDDDRDDAGAQEERRAIQQRRSVFLVSALAGVSLPFATATCTPCLNMDSGPHNDRSAGKSASASAPAPVVSSSAVTSGTAVPSTAAPSETTSAAAPSATARAPLAPAKPGQIVIDPAAAAKLGLPPIGFRADMASGGWSISPLSKEAYVDASGPPGGPLTLRVRPYLDDAAVDVLFKRVLSDYGGLDPIVTGPAEKVTLGGRALDAQSFRTGKSLGTTMWCVVKAPVGPGSKSGAVFLFGGGTNETAKPSCKDALDGAALSEIVKSLVFL